MAPVCRDFISLAFERPENNSGLMIQHGPGQAGYLVGFLSLGEELREECYGLSRFGGIAVVHCLGPLLHASCQLLGYTSRHGAGLDQILKGLVERLHIPREPGCAQGSVYEVHVRGE
ncbi:MULTISPECIES: hypothetical protein [unclassified Arthrobacter]|uniref:hypothetical protein n=1 Tax=unclassified Arthrobacter TaxID=235627 RepID=UPI003392E21E